MTNPATRRPYSRRAGDDTITWPNGSQFHVLAEAAHTEGCFSVMEDRAAQGFQTQPHLHRDADGAFSMLEGELTAHVGDQVFQATAGTFLFIPRGTPHMFRVTSEVARKLILFSPGGTEASFRAFFPVPEGYTREAWIAHVLETVGQLLTAAKTCEWGTRLIDQLALRG